MTFFHLFMNAKFHERLKKTKQHTLDYVSHKYSLSSIKEAGVLNISSPLTDSETQGQPSLSSLPLPSLTTGCYQTAKNAEASNQFFFSVKKWKEDDSHHFTFLLSALWFDLQL